MRFLFVIQGEGRGHMTQAIALYEMLKRNGHEVSRAMIGSSKNRVIPSFVIEQFGDVPIETYISPNFSSGGKSKGVDMSLTVAINVTPVRLRRFNRSMHAILDRMKEDNVDAVINFYEMLVGVTSLRFQHEVPIISIGHQFILSHPDFSKYDEGGINSFWMRINSMISNFESNKTLALSFYPLRNLVKRQLAVVPPLLRKEVFQLKPYVGDYILCYILQEGFADEIRAYNKRNPSVKLHVFWDKKDAPTEQQETPTLTFHRISDTKFLQLMEGCKAYVSTAGFESICEAMYLDKPVQLIPAHFEQKINALDAVQAGAGVASAQFDIDKILDYLETNPQPNTAFKEWVDQAESLYLKHLTSLL